MRLAMAIDTRKCVGCSDCMLACQMENNIPLDYTRSWVTERITGSYPAAQLSFQSERCNHCENAPCVRSCPTDASFVSEKGVVLVNTKKCIGCGACVESCPYEARYMNPVSGVADKCTFCDHRETPACVSVCPTKSMYFGDIEDPSSEIAQLIRSRPTETLLPEAGTRPSIYYLI